MDKHEFITSDKFLKLVESDSNIAYIKTDVLHLNSAIQWRGKHHTWRHAPVWITGHSDYGITQIMYDTYTQYTQHWYTVNKEVNHPNIHAIPLGITNDCDDSSIHRIFGNTDIMIDVMKLPRDIKNLVYMNISNTHPERRNVLNMFKDKSWVTYKTSVMTLEGRKSFLTDVRNHTFVLCPRGNGVDTHRLWETLYMGSIPIVQRHLALDEFSDLPICWIQDWNEVTENFLHKEQERILQTSWNMDKLKFSYWKNIILNTPV